MKKCILTLVLGVMVTLSLFAQGGITEPGATEPNSIATTTYDNWGPNQGPNRSSQNPPPTWNGLRGTDAGYSDNGSPIGAPWILLGFAAAYAGVRVMKKKE